MSFRLKNTKHFSKELKRLIKKYPSLKSEFLAVASIIKENPFYGKPLGNGFYKIRLAIASKGKGKSGGARIVTCIVIVEEMIYFAAIYDKSEKGSISQKELDAIISEL